MIRYPPGTRSSGREKSDIPRTQPALVPLLVDHDGFSGDHHDGFVLRVVPLEAARGAIPRYKIRSPVVTSYYIFGTSLRCPAQNPVIRHSRGIQRHCRRTDRNNTFRHRLLIRNERNRSSYSSVGTSLSYRIYLRP